MKKSWSRYWKSSKQPRKQRKWRYNAPLHARHKLMSAHLSEELRKQYMRRSFPLRKTDEVKIMRGEFTGKSGKIESIDMSALKIYVDGMKRKKVSGQEVAVPIDPSNVMITKLNMDDKERMKAIQKNKTQKAIVKPQAARKQVAKPKVTAQVKPQAVKPAVQPSKEKPLGKTGVKQ